MAKTPEEMKEDSDILRSERFLRARDDDYMRYTAPPAPIAAQTEKCWRCGNCHTSLLNPVLPPFGCPMCRAYNWSHIPDPGNAEQVDAARLEVACPKCGSDELKFCKTNADTYYVGCWKCGEMVFIFPWADKLRDFAQFFRAASLKRWPRGNAALDFEGEMEYIDSLRASSSPLETPAINYVAIVDESLNGNPSCHVCGAILTRKVQVGEPEKRVWACMSCGATTEPTKPADTPAAVLQLGTVGELLERRRAYDAANPGPDPIWSEIAQHFDPETPAPADTGAAKKFEDYTKEEVDAAAKEFGGIERRREAQERIREQNNRHQVAELLASTGDTPQPQEEKEKQ